MIKTLRNIAKCRIKKDIFGHECGDVCGILTVKEVRQEAIEWIHLLKRYEGEFGPIIPIKSMPGSIPKTIDGIPCCDGVEISKESISFIKFFFNITNDDLTKGGKK